MEEDNMLMLNLTADNSNVIKTRTILSKKERIQRNRQARRDKETIVRKQLAESREKQSESKSKSPKSPETGKRPVSQDGGQGHQKVKQKRKYDDLDASEETKSREPSKRFKSTLFQNNPEIPKLESQTVETLTEKVFSGDNFNEFNLHPFMVSNLEQGLGVTEATSVQKATLPHVLAGRDVLVKSQTGSGKTLAYAVPIVQELQEMTPKISRSDGTHALVIVPTRELALQSLATFQKLVKPFTWIVPGCLMGGEKKKSEKARLRKGLNILVSTPGRLTDHLENTRSLDLARVQWLIIDEADRLLDMGFEKDVSRVVAALKEKGPENRKTLLLSATLSTGVERLAGMSLNSPIKIDITSDANNPTQNSDLEKFATPENLKHHCVIVPSKLRLVSLAAFIVWKCKMATKRSKMLVFMSTQDSVDFHHSLFSKTLFDSKEETESENCDKLLYKLHGDMPQKERTSIFKQFAVAECGVLFCTDVAARGLDLPQVRWIVQYMPPGGSTDYVHRVGRTARIGSRGNALLFLTPAEAEFSKLLANNNISLIEVEMDDILQTLLVEKQRLDYLWQEGDVPHTIQEAASFVQLRFTEHVRLNRDTRTLARKAYQSFIGAYAAYPALIKRIFHMKDLHLGHVATSFGLQEAPTKIGNIVGTQLKKHNKPSHHKNKGERRGPLPSSMHTTNKSEYSSGFGKTKQSNSTKFTKREMRRQNAKKS